jgi:hypothetical protein
MDTIGILLWAAVIIGYGLSSWSLKRQAAFGLPERAIVAVDEGEGAWAQAAVLDSSLTFRR